MAAACICQTRLASGPGRWRYCKALRQDCARWPASSIRQTKARGHERSEIPLRRVPPCLGSTAANIEKRQARRTTGKSRGEVDAGDRCRHASPDSARAQTVYPRVTAVQRIIDTLNEREADAVFRVFKALKPPRINHEAPAPIDEEAQPPAAGLACETAETVRRNKWARGFGPAPFALQAASAAIISISLSARDHKQALIAIRVQGRDRVQPGPWPKICPLIVWYFLV
jgi:hypothetical protein